MDKKRLFDSVITPVMVFYIVLATFFLWLDVGNSYLGVNVASFMSALIPSIPAVAALSSAGLSGVIVLSLSWVMIIPTWLLINVYGEWSGFDIRRLKEKQPIWVHFVFYVVAVLMVWGAVVVTPSLSDKQGMYSKPVIFLLSNYKYSIVFYGMFFLLVISMFLNYITGVPLFYFRNKFSGDKK